MKLKLLSYESEDTYEPQLVSFVTRGLRDNPLATIFVE
jgi:hypothetical protein